jgi:cobalt-zinc-cadmium efflux system protein
MQHSDENISTVKKDRHEGHNHGKAVVLTNVNSAFIIGILLNLAYVIVQIIIGFRINSLSLLSDAGHNFLDVGALALSLLAFRLTKVKATEKYTYGYKKSSILVSLLNAIILLISIGAIAYEAINRFKNPQIQEGFTISIVAAIGIFVNVISAFMFFRDKEKDMNIKFAFIHLITDALVSLALVIGGIVIYYTHLYWIDAVLSLIVCAVVIVSTWSLLKDSFHLSLDGVPGNVDFNKVKEITKNIHGVLDFHHIHIWAISTTENALTGHLIVSKDFSSEQIRKIKHDIKDALEHLNIGHCTLEIESEDDKCEEETC